jgi:hypothetical protein
MKYIKDIGEEVEVQFAINEILALNSAFAEVCYGLIKSDFESRIGISNLEAEILSEPIFETLEKMEEGSIECRVGDRRRKISKNLPFLSVNLPHTPPKRKECYLNIGQYQFVLLLFSLDTCKTFAGYQTLLINQNNQEQIIAKTSIQQVSLYDLPDLIAYFDEYIDLVKNNLNLDPYLWSLRSRYGHLIFTLQVLSGSIISKDEGFLELGFKFDTRDYSDEESKETYLDIQSAISLKDILIFTSSILDFLKELTSSK